MGHLDTAYKLGAFAAKVAFNPMQTSMQPVPPQITPGQQRQQIAKPQLGVAGINPSTLQNAAMSSGPGTPTGGPSSVLGQRLNPRKNTSVGSGKSIASPGQPQMNMGAAPGKDPWGGGGSPNK